MINTMKNLNFVDAPLNPVYEITNVLQWRKINILCIPYMKEEKKEKSKTCRVKRKSVPEQEVKSWPCIPSFQGLAHTGNGFMFLAVNGSLPLIHLPL